MIMYFRHRRVRRKNLLVEDFRDVWGRQLPENIIIQLIHAISRSIDSVQPENEKWEPSETCIVKESKY